MNLEQLIQRQQELLNAARAANREFTAEEQAEYDSCQRQIDEIRKVASGQQNTQTDTGANNDAERAAAAEAARAAERERIREIESVCNYFGVESRSFIDSGVSAENVRKQIMEKLIANNAPIPQNGHADVTRDAADKFRDAASDAILMRAGIEPENPADGARELRHLSLRDMFIQASETEGENASNLMRMSENDLYAMASRQFFNPTSAFPAILDSTINKAYKEGHKKVAVTFDRFTKKGSLKDFKTNDNYYLAGPAGEFLEVPEGGELKHDVFEDKKLPTRKLRTYGRQFTLTRQAFINDDIDLVTRVPAKYAASARKTINTQVYRVLVDNAVIYDGTQLFTSGHKNLLATGTGFTQAAFQKMITALQSQTDEFGQSIIIRPATIVVPVGMSFDVYAVLHSPMINTAGNTQAVNPLYNYANQIEVVEDPTINALCGGAGNQMPWFLFGAEEDTDCIEVDYLNGQEIPTIRRMEAPGTLGFIWDIYLDWGVTVMDFRGVVKNPGTTIADPLS